MKLLQSLSTSELYRLASFCERDFRTKKLSRTGAQANRAMKKALSLEAQLRSEGKRSAPQEERVVMENLA